MKVQVLIELHGLKRSEFGPTVRIEPIIEGEDSFLTDMAEDLKDDSQAYRLVEIELPDYLSDALERIDFLDDHADIREIMQRIIVAFMKQQKEEFRTLAQMTAQLVEKICDIQ